MCLTLIIGLLGVLFASFGINMIPFLSPSNLFIASDAALLVNSDPVIIGALVALGATCAKLVHYTVSFFVGKHVGEERRKRLTTAALKTKRWAFLTVFIVAATPIPDDPVVIPLALMKYSPVKFASAYFLGKLLIGITGALLVNFGGAFLSDYLSLGALIVISIVLTIIVTSVLLKVDLSNIEERILKRLGLTQG